MNATSSAQPSAIYSALGLSISTRSSSTRAGCLSMIVILPSRYVHVAVICTMAGCLPVIQDLYF